ncbi:hypothetical protein Tco_1554084 [Tanacetum coccineum]
MLMRQRFLQPTNDPLALVSNASVQQNKAYGSRRQVVDQDVREDNNANNQGRPFKKQSQRGNVVAGNVGAVFRTEEAHYNPADHMSISTLMLNEAPNLADHVHGTKIVIPFVDHMDEYHEVHEMQNDEDGCSTGYYQSRLANKPDKEKSKVVNESDSTIPDPSHQTITTTLPEITPFIALQLRVAKLEQDMSEVKKTGHSAAVLASIKSKVPTVVDKCRSSPR